jgi:hypothetical protein
MTAIICHSLLCLVFIAALLWIHSDIKHLKHEKKGLEDKLARFDRNRGADGKFISGK